MDIETITKSKKNEHHYTDREKEQAVENYREITVKEVHRMFDLHDKYLKQVDHKNFKSEKYDFELHNQLSFDIEQCKRRVKYAAKNVEDNYNIDVEVPDFEVLLENHQK